VDVDIKATHPVETIRPLRLYTHKPVNEHTHTTKKMKIME
jgi:hypothetical protein